MKVTFGRKFLAAVIVTIILTAFLVISGIMFPDAITATVMMIYGIMVTFIWTAYIGGNTFKAFVKSKYFRAELQEVPPGK